MLDVAKLLVDAAGVLAIFMVARAIRGYWGPPENGESTEVSNIDDLME